MKKNKLLGFTLLELVIALGITSLILLFIGSAFLMSYRSEEKTSEKEELLQRIRIINERLTWLIRGVYPFVKVSPEGNMLYFYGRDDTIGFVTTSTLSTKTIEERAGLTFMSLFLDNNRLKIKEKIFFQKDIFEDSGGKEYVLFDGIYSINFRYLDGNAAEGEEEWVSEWLPEEKDYLPSAIKITLSLISRDDIIELPPIVVHIPVRKRLI